MEKYWTKIYPQLNVPEGSLVEGCHSKPHPRVFGGIFLISQHLFFDEKYPQKSHNLHISPCSLSMQLGKDGIP